MAKQGGLKRSLGLWALVALGLGYMTPTILFDTFGIVTIQTDGAVPLAYLVALVVMIFTAISYGRMAKVYPTAGSAYTYTRESMHPRMGFMVGWAALLDYLLLPLVNALIIRLYMTSFFPEVPGWIWVVVFVAVITASQRVEPQLDLEGELRAGRVRDRPDRRVRRARHRAALPRNGHGTLATTQPFFHSGVHMSRSAHRRDRRLLLLHRLRRHHDVHRGDA